jgi:Restriction endonuclease
MTEPGSKRFEKHMHKMHRRLAPKGAKITYNDKITGFDSKTERQVETSIRYRLAQYDILLIIDCKDYSDPVDVLDMGAFKSLAKDVRANKALMISTSGYTAAAIEMARSAGIETRTYLDTGNSEWHSDVSIPTLLSRIKIESWNVRFSAVPGHQSGIPSEPQQVPFPLIETIAPDGTPLGPVLVLLGKKWHEDESLQVPGEHAFNLAEHVVIRDGANEFHSRIDAEIRVIQRHYFGPLALNLQGFKNDQNGSIITNEMKTDFIDPARIERGEMPDWIEIRDKNELAVSVTLAMRYVDTLPETLEEFHRMRNTWWGSRSIFPHLEV